MSLVDYIRPKKYANIPDTEIEPRNVEAAFNDFLCSLWENVVKTHGTITIKTTPEVIRAITGEPNTITYKSDVGDVNFEVTDFEDNIGCLT